MTILSPLAAALSVAFLLSSCAKKEDQEETPQPAPTSQQTETVETTPPIQQLGFADPNTTNKLIIAEETKTIINQPSQGSISEGDQNTVNVTPPLPEATLPEAPAN